ncbi:hypothetical protein M758_12G000300 [Ceratodon purpureus]|nr:hypothetical protein M758_12G000300 [Ceratodon purpureus]
MESNLLNPEIPVDFWLACRMYQLERSCFDTLEDSSPLRLVILGSSVMKLEGFQFFNADFTSFSFRNYILRTRAHAFDYQQLGYRNSGYSILHMSSAGSFNCWFVNPTAVEICVMCCLSSTVIWFL